MIDPAIKQDIETIKSCIDQINELMATLHERGVEVRIAYKDSSNGGGSGCVPHIELWRATEHVNYLEDKNYE